MVRALIILCVLIFTQGMFWAPTQTIQNQHTSKIGGLTLVAPPQKFPSDPFPEVIAQGANYISCIPYGFVRFGTSQLRYNLDFQWWGERAEGVKETIQLAHKNGLKVMLKPQVWSPEGWIGEYDPGSPKKWEEWEKYYTEFILFYAGLAEENQVEIFCIGTELKIHMAKRPQYFKSLIPKIKEIYCGKITYSSNWDNYKNIPIWDELDYVGLSAYFPLVEDKTPEVEKLIGAWSKVEKELRVFSKKQDRQILFTEFGYLSVDGAGGKTWELEKKVRRLKVNEKAQANCFEAILKVFGEQDYWAGGFIWKWFPHGQGGEGYNEKDYTPQGKQASKVIKSYYSSW